MNEKIRKEIYALGADVCGFAGIERFAQAPAGFHPRDLYGDCKSVIVLGIALPKGLLEVKPDLIYGHFNYQTCPKVDEIALKAAKIIEDTYGGRAVPIPCDGPYDYWDSEKKEGKGLLSMKHAAVNAGIGTLGKNTLLLNRKYGNRLILGAVLTNLSLESDTFAEPVCIDSCNLCVKSCPVGALDGKSAVQKLCRENTYGKNKKGFDTVVCNRCRSVCPMRFGREDGKKVTAQDIFPECVRRLPEADIPFDSYRAYLSQGESHQILFMQFAKDTELPEHFHESQWAVVLEGRIDLTIDGETRIYQKGDRYFIPKGKTHYGKIYAGYADITYFDQRDRYHPKN